MTFDLFALRVRKLSHALRVPRFRHALRLGVLAAVEQASGLRHLKPDLVLDVGANRGQFALLARHLWPRARIASFEPLPGAGAICRSVMAGDEAFTLFEVAVASTTGTSGMNVTSEDDSSSLLPLGQEHQRLYGSKVSARIEVRTGRIVEFIAPSSCPKSCLMKIDTQGFELEVLKGSEELLPSISHIYAELSFVELYAGQPLASEVISYLHTKGYGLTGVFNVAVEGVGRPVQADMLFVRRVDA
ncbi:FkbM family methyltransferase [Bradyrhizobium sp. 38]|uniref:FkbM family methyltransferase n=1 Tax=unclassified Bradyrhizobium TaxID=2631580 RepID=UPI001FFAAE86|nr:MULTISPECIES: FkbM family methyltransferase [unclassified Bradyrhizobium]MCK1341632.1 FkbM family methyltransferase [Bradyrhizobium sp. 38]MCK1778837.1 FkbM family methyltransferase [Bradyrhizobium sp. 132]